MDARNATPLCRPTISEVVARAYRRSRRKYGVGGPVSLLLPCLHGIRDELGYIPCDVKAALGHLCGFSAAHVGTVMTAYEAFRDREPTLRIGMPTCVGNLTKGGPALFARMCELLGLEEGQARLLHGKRVIAEHVSCHGRCVDAPYLAIGDRVHTRLTVKKVERLARALLAGSYKPIVRRISLPPMPEFVALRAAMGMGPEAIIKCIKESKLDGRGGALFAAGTKWEGLRNARIQRPKYIVVNGDEGEPGTVKDGSIIRGEVPGFTVWSLLEGILITALATGATEGYIYIRHEYPDELALLDRAIRFLEQSNLLGSNILGTGWRFKLRTFRGAIGYVRGEVTALLNSMEGGQGIPRRKQGRTTEQGLAGKPTLVNNVETLSWVPAIVSNGAAWFVDEGCPRIYSLSGDVRAPRCIVASQRTTLAELLAQAGGMEGDFLAAFPGGFSTKPVVDTALPMNWDALTGAGSSPGSGAVMVLSVARKPELVTIARHVAAFFNVESCRQCTWCDLGTKQVCGELSRPHVQLAQVRARALGLSRPNDKELYMCGLGQGAFVAVAELLRLALE